MSVIKDKNFSTVPLDQIPRADEYVRCNFSRQQPDMSGAQPEGWPLPWVARFVKCNLTNVRPATGSLVDKYTNTQLVELDVPGTVDDVLVIDGVEQSRRTRPVTRVHARRWTAGNYERHGTPLEFEGR